jgi:dihydropteroate synthase
LCCIGILNATPDSFSDGGLFLEPEDALLRAAELLAHGAKVLDLGGESTSPGAKPVMPDQEWARLAPLIKHIRAECPNCALSIDTRHSEVASLALNAGADIINDVTGFQDQRMLALASVTNCGLIATRSRMANGQIWMPDYLDPTPKNANLAIEELKIVKERLLGAGISAERILLDPGFGFGTTYLEDCALWEALPDMPRLLNWPIERFCLGISRKRFVSCRYGASGNACLDEKTAELHEIALNVGYKVFRTHSIGRLPSGS